VIPGRYTVAVAVAGKRATQEMEVRPDPRREVARAELEGRHTASTRLARLQRAFDGGAKLWKAMQDERTRIDGALADRKAVRDSLAPLLGDVGQRLDSLGARFRPGFGGPKFAFLDLDGSLQASSMAPTVSQQRSIDQLDAKLRADLEALNTLLAGPFADLRRRAAGAVGAALEPVRIDERD
jgi:hypothetical protein